MDVSPRMRYWREQLADQATVIQLYSEQAQASLGSTWDTLAVTISSNLTESLRALSSREDVTLFVTLLGAFSTLLYRYTGQEDFLVGSFMGHSGTPPIEHSSGYVLNAVPLRITISGDPSFSELLKHLRNVTLEALSNEVPFEDLLRGSADNGDSGHTSVFQVMFSLLPLIPRPDLEYREISKCSHSKAPEHDIHLKVHDGPGGLVGDIAFKTDVFQRATIARMLEHWKVLLEAISTYPEQQITRLPFLTDAERYQLLVSWNETKKTYPRNTCLHEMIEAQAARTPEAVAIVHDGQQMSYRLLNARANQLSQFLRKLGVGPDNLVGVCVERSPELIVALLGILKSGGAYVPLDPLYPTGRLSMMVEDSALKVLVTQDAFLSKFSNYQGHLVCLDQKANAIADESAENESGGARVENLAYVIYTSGSTGKPKGVQISHRSLVNFLISMQSSPGLRAEDMLLAITTVAFDIAALELYLPLTVGARVMLVTRETGADGYKLRQFVERSAPTVMQATPATWRLLLEAGWQGDKELKALCGGEAMPRELALELLKRVASLWNMYGPTETTVWSTTCQISSADGPIAIGRPIANTEIYILDKHLQPVPVGVPGELYIGGEGIARGYLNRPDLTAEKFLPNPFVQQGSTGRVYKTGDLARYRANGEIECLGRIDHQVKVRGFRIELGEIESVLGEYPGVRQNVVVAREDTPGDKQLVAYVVVGQGYSLAADSLRNFLKQKLPDYMLPSRFMFLDTLPLTPNGKVDRKALPTPTQQGFTQEREYVPPRNTIESQLVKIWESILNIRPVGVKENFFELGGHSLLVGKLIRRIEQAFGHRLSMAAIFEARTVEQQASMLRRGCPALRHSAVVPVQPAGSKPPFFCFGFNAGPVFLPLAQRLGSDQPLLGVDPTLLRDSELNSPFNMETIAASLLKQILELQPDGPYYLGGFCGGGLMAYEVASQLVALGQQVKLLALFEPQTPADYNSQSNGSLIHSLNQKLKFHFHNLQQLKVKEGRAYYEDRAKVLLVRFKTPLLHIFRTLRSRNNDDKPRHLGYVVDFSLIYRDYQPQPFTGEVTLFQAADRPSDRGWHSQYWKNLSASLEVHEIPGHWNWVARFFLEPNVEVLATKLKEHLASTEGKSKSDDCSRTDNL
jgi:amino acid adenylation domain-containing protein